MYDLDSTLTEGPAHPPPGEVWLRDLSDAEQFFARMGIETREMAAFAFVDSGSRLLGVHYTKSPARGTVRVSLRDVAADALAFGATGVVMAHNHPSGNCQPSAVDLATTRNLARGLLPLGVRLLDHIVIADGDCFSFRRSGLL